MSNAFSLDRLTKLENQRRFLDWFVWHRFEETLTMDELTSFARDGHLPNPLPNRPSRLDDLDRNSLIKRWQEEERTFAGRSREELDSYATQGFWPEQKGRLRYFLEDGKLNVEWQSEPEEESKR